MAGALQHDTLGDFVNLTLDKNIKDKWVDISMEFNEYVFARFFKKQTAKSMSGPRCTWKIQVRNLGNAKPSELFAVRSRGRRDLTTSASQNWAKVDFGFDFDLDEDEFQGSMETIVNTLEVLEHSAHNDYFEYQEAAMWNGPSSPTERPRVMCGIPHWIVKDEREGLYGGNPEGFPEGAGGINSDTYDQWRNWTASFLRLNRTDGIRKWKKACRRTKFYAAHNFKQLDAPDGEGHPWEYWTTDENVAELEELLDVGNDKTGPDLAKYMDKVLFKGCMVRQADYLSENDPDHPIYGINWQVIRYYSKKGKELKRLPTSVDSDAPTVRHVDFYHWGQMVSHNRRRTFVIYKRAA